MRFAKLSSAFDPARYVFCFGADPNPNPGKCFAELVLDGAVDPKGVAPAAGASTDIE